MSTCVGVVAVQGDVPEHAAAMERALDGDVTTRAIRDAGTIPACDIVVLPGGESTTISRLIRDGGLDEELRAHVAAGKPLLATCAGIIVAAREANDERIHSLDFLDVTIDRNAFGRQRESFEAPIAVEGMPEPYPGVFIRAPKITDIGGADVLATFGDEPVAVRQDSVVGACFHPELTTDPRFHRRALAAVQ